MSKLLDPIIPIFTLADLQNGTRNEEFQRCLSEKGVFYLTDHGIPECEYQSFRTTTTNFFRNASDQERADVTNKNPATRRGFSELESESTAKSTNAGNYTDYSICYSMGVSDNLFPSAAFEQIWSKHFNHLDQLANTIAEEVLKNNTKRSTDVLLNCDPVLRFRYFPEVPENRCAEDEPLRMAPHYDISVVTLISQTECPSGFVSLQCNIDGVFVELPPMPNALIVMCGAVTLYLTGGQVKAPIHRVVSPSREQRVGSGRTSDVFFLRPRPEFEMLVADAKACGLNIDADSVTITLQDWVGRNYENLKASG